MSPVFYLSGETPPTEGIFGWRLGMEAERRGKPKAELVLEVLQRLARKMALDGMFVGPDSNNPDVPAGYTYLGQLIAHDVIFNNTADLAGQREEHERPFASPALDLDCLYRGGPERSPIIYAWAKDADERCLLRMGKTSGRAYRGPDTGSKHPSASADPVAMDLPGLSLCPEATSSSEVPEKDPQGRCPADRLIGDPRNDNNLILSQICVLFHRFHNKVCAEVAGQSDIRPGKEVFEIARMVVIDTYRHIVRNDYLSHILEPRTWMVQQKAQARGEHFYAKRLAIDPTTPLPSEFWLGAMRIGHAMAQPVYEINGVQPQPVSLATVMSFRRANVHNPQNVAGQPVTNDWLVDLDRFFAADDHEPVIASRRIRPAIARALYSGKSLQPADLEGVRSLYERLGGVPFRDLARGYLRGLPNSQYLAAMFGVPHLSRSELIGDDRSGLRGMYGASIKNPLQEADFDAIGALADDTPLEWYLLREAEVQNGGRRLGALGSAIIADILFSLLDRAAEQPPRQLGFWKRQIFGETHPATMRGIIRYVDAEHTERRAGRPGSQTMA
ncbi:peroxidase family protein [Oricola cellulosilytica]|nr:peroxidase family protein [Oricola cellulosilytica]